MGGSNVFFWLLSLGDGGALFNMPSMVMELNMWVILLSGFFLGGAMVSSAGSCTCWLVLLWVIS